MEQKITLEISQIAIQEPKTFLSKWYQNHKYLEKNHNSFFKNFCGKNPTYYIYCISVSALSVSVLADMKNVISVFDRYRPIRKLSVSGFISIGRYEKKLISRALSGVVTGQNDGSWCYYFLECIDAFL